MRAYFQSQMRVIEKHSLRENCTYYPSNSFCNTRCFENWGIFGHMTYLDQSRVSGNI